MTSTLGTAFDRVTNVHGDDEGQYSATLDSDWDGPFGRPNGGVIAAILLRAAQAELAQPELPPRVVSVHYPLPATRDPAQLTVHLLRAGGRNATVQVNLHQNGQLTASALITFSASRPHALTITEPAPSAPPPDQVEELSPHSLDQAPPSLRQLRLRPCFGAPILTGATDAVTGGWCSLRDDAEDQLSDAARLVALTDLWWPAVFTASRHLVGTPTLELTIYLRTTAPVPGPILGRFTTRTIHEGHLEETGQLWSTTGQLLAESRQLALLIERPPSKDG